MTTLNLEQTQIYRVRVTSQYGCQDETQVTVFVQNEIFVPELFSPNQDGINDLLTVLGDGIANIDFRIYDRRGVEVYRATTIDQAQVVGWDGTQQGQDLPIGDYFWSLSGQFLNGDNLQVNGTSSGRIRLIR
ncbi:MAG TPA: hypothetical protein DCR93_06135 [Cytophagales bacterium]|nr:hypothetical protein [Cytophagales bacterium]